MPDLIGHPAEFSGSGVLDSRWSLPRALIRGGNDSHALLFNLKIILESPIVSEKAAGLKDKKNTYVFKVAKSANKRQIAEAVKKMFGVTPQLVRTLTLKGKQLPLNRFRVEQYKSDWKKAYVTLKEGEKIKELE